MDLVRTRRSERFRVQVNKPLRRHDLNPQKSLLFHLNILRNILFNFHLNKGVSWTGKVLISHFNHNPAVSPISKRFKVFPTFENRPNNNILFQL